MIIMIWNDNYETKHHHNNGTHNKYEKYDNIDSKDNNYNYNNDYVNSYVYNYDRNENNDNDNINNENNNTNYYSYNNDTWPMRLMIPDQPTRSAIKYDKYAKPNIAKGSEPFFFTKIVFFY